MTSVGRILQFPPIDEVPEHLRGRSFAVVEAFFVGSAEEGDALLEPLRALGPELDTVAMVPPIGLAEMHMDPPDPMPYAGEGLLLGGLPPEAIDAFVAAAGPTSGSTLVSAEIRHTGGALARSGDHHGALDTLPGAYMTFWVGMAFTEEMGARTRSDLHQVTAALLGYRSGSYLNFEEEATESSSFYSAETYSRLREVKAMVDPDELIRSNHPIPPAA
jgi:hypothetical protein